MRNQQMIDVLSVHVTEAGEKLVTMLTEETRERMWAAVISGDAITVKHLAMEYKAHRTNGVISAELDCLIRRAIESLSVDIVEALISAGANVNHEDIDGQRALHTAAKVGDATIIKLLIRGGSLLNSVDRNGNSALHLSAVCGNRAASLMLIDACALVNRPRRYDTGEAPLHAIARTGDAVVMAAALCQGGGRLDLHASNGVTPLHVAAREHHSGCVSVLCEAARNKAALSSTDNNKVTPLHCAVQVSALECVRLLLQYGANVNAADRDGLTPLHYAAANRHPASISYAGVIDLLLEFGANVCCLDLQRRTPLHWAAETGNTALVSRLLMHGSNVDAVERLGSETAINIAASYGRHGIIQLLVESGCDVNIADKNGVSPLHKLLSSGANADSFIYDSIDLLLRHGARINAIDNVGATPLQACVFHTIISRHSIDGLSVLRRLVAAGAVLHSILPGAPANIQRRALPVLRNSPLCWLTWHGELTAAAFLINAGWRLSGEHWIVLPGKTHIMESFLVSVRTVACNPKQLRLLCRAVIREQLQRVSNDRDVVPLVERLPLPTQIHKYLNFDSESDTLE